MIYMLRRPLVAGYIQSHSSAFIQSLSSFHTLYSPCNTITNLCSRRIINSCRTSSSAANNVSPPPPPLLHEEQEEEKCRSKIFNDVLPNWFDGDIMSQGLREMKEMIENGNVKCLIEVRNSRMPYTQHPLFKSFTLPPYNLKHLIVLTHAEYLSNETKDRIRMHFQRDHDTQPLFVALDNHKKMKTKHTEPFRSHILKSLSDAYIHDSDIPVHMGFAAGLPNVGKSTLLYVLSKEITLKKRTHKTKHLPKVNDRPGHTERVKTHWVDVGNNINQSSSKSNRKRIVNSKLIDTPGLSLPLDYIKQRASTNIEFVMQLALLGSMPVKATRKRALNLVEYLLHRLNQLPDNGNDDYVTYFNLKERTSDANVLLQVVEKSEKGKLDRIRDRNKFAERIVKDWRKGYFGRDIVLDTPY